jgi:hypothetical protein
MGTTPFSPGRRGQRDEVNERRERLVSEIPVKRKVSFDFQ